MEFERARRRHSHINIAPLVDVVFLLLIFFMLAYQLVSDHGIHVRLPEAASAEAQDASEVTITLADNGDIYLDGSQISIEELEGALRRLRASEDQRLFVRADRATEVGLLVQVMDAARLAAYSNIGILADKK